MKIIFEEWISSQRDEAIVTISDGNYDITVFAHPYKNSIGDNITEPLQVLEIVSIELLDALPLSIERINNGFGHHIIAKILQKNPGMFAVGELVFELDDDLPSYFSNGDVVGFVCSRVDLW